MRERGNGRGKQINSLHVVALISVLEKNTNYYIEYNYLSPQY